MAIGKSFAYLLKVDKKSKIGFHFAVFSFDLTVNNHVGKTIVSNVEKNFEIKKEIFFDSKDLEKRCQKLEDEKKASTSQN